jgi:hypothetical protein
LVQGSLKISRLSLCSFKSRIGISCALQSLAMSAKRPLKLTLSLACLRLGVVGSAQCCLESAIGVRELPLHLIKLSPERLRTS